MRRAQSSPQVKPASPVPPPQSPGLCCTKTTKATLGKSVRTQTLADWGIGDGRTPNLRDLTQNVRKVRREIREDMSHSTLTESVKSESLLSRPTRCGVSREGVTDGPRVALAKDSRGRLGKSVLKSGKQTRDRILAQQLAARPNQSLSKPTS